MATTVDYQRNNESIIANAPANTTDIDYSLAKDVCALIQRVLQWTDGWRGTVHLDTPFNSINVDPMIREGIKAQLDKNPSTRVSESVICAAQSARDIVVAVLRARNARYPRKEKP